MTAIFKTSAAAALGLALAACTQQAPPAQSAHDAFFANLSSFCGNAYEGRLVTSDAQDSDMAGQRLVVHFRECSEDTIRAPFHVGEDRSRTWVITRTAEGLRLKHDHRHEDGSEDVLTQYGGDTASEGSAERQEFPADQFSQDLFVANDIPQSATNVWALEAHPGQSYVYELRRENRHFRVEFDATTPVEPPPAPWGAE